VEDVHQAIVDAVRSGSTIDQAAYTVGVNLHTLRRWLSTGRKAPDGPYGELARTVDGLRNGEVDVTDIARDFISACAIAFSVPPEKTDLPHPAFVRAVTMITELSPLDRKKVEVVLAWHAVVAAQVIVSRLPEEERADMTAERAVGILCACVEMVDESKEGQ
jgi:hypothetical protein